MKKLLLLSLVVASSISGAYADIELPFFHHKEKSGPGEVYFRGEINKRSINSLLARVDKALSKGPEVIISLDTGGGNINEAIRAVLYMREKNTHPEISISTLVRGYSECESACTILFTGGKKRFASSRTKFGFHSPKYESGDRGGLTKAQVEEKFRHIWLSYISAVDPEAAEMVERNKYLNDYEMTYVSERELETGYVTDVL